MGERDQDFILNSFRNRDAIENVGTVLRWKAFIHHQGHKEARNFGRLWLCELVRDEVLWRQS